MTSDERDVARIRRFCAERELETVFQPLFDLESNECIAFEALTRFPRGPDRGTAEWFASATELGVAAELELAAVETALSYLDQFPPDTTLAINISATIAITPEFFALVAPFADRLIVELTEHEPVDDYDTLAESLTHLRKLGARIAVDDVGAGFASLRHILRLAPEIVKLDLSLTRGMESEPTSRALTSAFVDFANRTGVLITAEGIETEHELGVLRALGVDHGQGYYLGPPRPLAAQLN